jgi:hypothetical protein
MSRSKSEQRRCLSYNVFCKRVVHVSEWCTPKHHTKYDIFYTDIATTMFLFYYYLPIAVDKAFQHYISILTKSKTYIVTVSKITLLWARIIYILFTMLQKFSKLPKEPRYHLKSIVLEGKVPIDDRCWDTNCNLSHLVWWFEMPHSLTNTLCGILTSYGTGMLPGNRLRVHRVHRV